MSQTHNSRQTRQTAIFSNYDAAHTQGEDALPRPLDQSACMKIVSLGRDHRTASWSAPRTHTASPLRGFRACLRRPQQRRPAQHTVRSVRGYGQSERDPSVGRARRAHGTTHESAALARTLARDERMLPPPPEAFGAAARPTPPRPRASAHLRVRPRLALSRRTSGRCGEYIVGPADFQQPCTRTRRLDRLEYGTAAARSPLLARR